MPCDPDRNVTCDNGGECDDEEVAQFCDCKKGTSGDFCGTVDDCVKKRTDCGEDGLSGGTCYYNVDKLSADCKCENESLGFDKQVKMCRCKRAKNFINNNCQIFTSVKIVHGAVSKVAKSSVCRCIFSKMAGTKFFFPGSDFVDALCIHRVIQFLSHRD